MNHPAAPSRRPERDPVRHIADLVSGGLELEAESELISLAESRTLDAATRCQLARLSLQIEKPHLARGILEAALKSAPRSTDVRFLCGLAEKALGHLHESLEHFSLAAPETNPDAAYYVSIVHEELGHLEKARQAIEWALAIAPEDADYLNQSACVLAHLGEHEQALAASDAALSMEPQSAGLALNHAHNLLLHGRYAEAWPLYEARLAFTPDHLPPRNGSAPWEGQSLEGKSLLVWHEQGLGDTIHFTNFYDTATAVRSLDLVISADTAVAHLSASCGIPTWVLLPHTPDWRWGLGRETTPWYPAARLFRQPSPGDWRAVIQAVQKALL